MSKWISITLANLYDAKICALLDACDTVALANGQTARSPGIIQGVVDDIRRKIASCRRNQLDVNVTAIPSGLKNLAVDLIIAKLKKAIEQDLTEDERRELSVNERNLNRIAEGLDVVEQPDNALPSYNEMQSSVGTTFQSGCRKATREKMDGL